MFHTKQAQGIYFKNGLRKKRFRKTIDRFRNQFYNYVPLL